MDKARYDQLRHSIGVNIVARNKETLRDPLIPIRERKATGFASM